MKKLVLGVLAASPLLIVGCGADPSKDASDCIRNMITLQTAVEAWGDKHSPGFEKMPTMKQLIDDGCDGLIDSEVKCPTDGSMYSWRYDEDAGIVKVSCPHADKGHAVKGW